MRKKQEEKLFSIAALASRLGLSTTGIRKLEQRGLIPPGQRLVGSNHRVWRASEIDFDAIAAQRGQGSSTSRAA